MSMLKFKVNGIYKNGYGASGKRIDYECNGKMPVCDEIYHQQNANRLIGFWIKEAGYTERFEEFETVYIDTVEEVDEPCPIDGKNIKELDWLGLQYLACKHHLNAIPLHNQVSLYEARIKACKEYMDKVLKREAPNSTKISEFPDLILSGSNYQAEPEEVLNNEEILNSMQKKKDLASEEFTIDELKKLADDGGIKYHTNIGYAALHKKVFS